jgi:hypothetical protein
MLRPVSPTLQSLKQRRFNGTNEKKQSYGVIAPNGNGSARSQPLKTTIKRCNAQAAFNSYMSIEFPGSVGRPDHNIKQMNQSSSHITES